MDERAPDDGPATLDEPDAAALGTAPPPEPAPLGAEVDATETRVPGATFDGPDRTAKPWATSLAAGSSQAGVANEPVAEDPLQDALDDALDDDHDD